MEYIVTKLKHRFLQNMLTIDNSFKLIKLLCILVMLFHLFACAWIYIGNVNDGFPGWRIREGLGVTLLEQRYIYVTSIYFVCTTATTIGYGDYGGSTETEKYFLLFLEFAGICIFSAITDNIRGLKSMPKIKDVINDRIMDVNNFLFDIDNLLCDTKLPDHIYDASTDYIDQSYRYGVAQSFVTKREFRILS